MVTPLPNHPVFSRQAWTDWAAALTDAAANGGGSTVPLDSPAFTGTPTVNGTPVAKTSDVSAAIAGLVNGASTALDTLSEIDAQLAADEGSAAALATTVAGKLAKASNLSDLASAATARTNLGLGTAAVQASSAFDAAGAGLTNADPASQQLAADGVSLASPWQSFRTFPQRPPSKIITRMMGAQSWTGTGVTEDLTTVLFGDRTVKQAAPVSGTCWPTVPAIAAQDWSTSVIRLWLKVDVPANLNSLAMYVNMGSGNTASAGFQANYLPGEWTAVTIPRANFSLSGGVFAWNGVTGYSIRLDANASGAINVWVGGVELIPDLAATYPGGVMVCELDDGFTGQFTNGVPVFASRGVPVTYNVIGSNFVGSPSTTGKYAADLRNLQDLYGWQISCHAYSAAAHSNVGNSAATMEADFQRQKQWLHANGLHSGADHYALCPGTGSPLAAGAMMTAVEKSFRSVRVNSGYWETTIPGDPLRLRSVLFSGAGQTVANVKANIDKVAGAGGVYIFAMHDIIAGSTDGTSNGLAAIAAGNLGTILDYASSKGMVFRTRADYIDGR